TGYFNTVFQARVRLDLLTILDLVGRVGSVIGIIASVYLKLNFYYIIGSVLFGNTISFLLGMYLLPETVKTSFDYKFAKRLFLLSLPVGITSLLSTLYFKIDTIILSLYKPASDVGVYSLGYKILDNITLFWLFYVGTIYPILTRFKLENENKYRRLFKNSIILACIVSVPIVVISYFIAPLAINIFGGASFNDAIFALRILVFSLPFIFVNVLFYNFYIIEEFNIVVILGMLITLVINIVLNVVYIPRFSYIAASYITILSEVVLSVVYIIGVLYLKSRRNYEK
ncbi:MAG TPA: oligosaccharide flippase family protein, partial [Patescibacteria group bacterium]